MKNVLGIILGGGRGTRLYPLTQLRCKPAVPLGGKHRLIDIPLSNCINSEIRKIFVVTQFNSASLMSHVHRTYTFDNFSQGFVEILAAEQTLESSDWYQGTADAVRQNLRRIKKPEYSQVLVLSGDQLYRMNFEHLVNYHREMKADITLAVIPVRGEDASRFGILRVGEGARVREFVEKPRERAVLDRFRVTSEARSTLGLSASAEDASLASMGIYVFNPDALSAVLEDRSKLDFGKDIFENVLDDLEIVAYPFEGYWEDIGTIGAFHRANLALTQHHSAFDFFDYRKRVFTRPRFLPASKVLSSTLQSVLIAEGCRIMESEIAHSVVGVRSIIREGSRISDTVVMGMDFYPSGGGGARNVPFGIGRDCVIHRAIIDKGARIGDGCLIRGAPDRLDEESDIHAVRDGIVVIPKNAILPAGTVI